MKFGTARISRFAWCLNGALIVTCGARGSSFAVLRAAGFFEAEGLVSRGLFQLGERVRGRGLRPEPGRGLALCGGDPAIGGRCRRKGGRRQGRPRRWVFGDGFAEIVPARDSRDHADFEKDNGRTAKLRTIHWRCSWTLPLRMNMRAMAVVAIQRAASVAAAKLKERAEPMRSSKYWM